MMRIKFMSISREIAQVNVARPHQWLVNIVACNGLV